MAQTQPTSIFHQVQQIIADQLNSDEMLSAANVTFVAENSKAIDYEVQNALGKQGIVGVVMTPKADYIGITDRGELAYELRDLTIQIVENVPVNRGLPSSTTALDAAQRAQEILASPNFTTFGVMNPVNIEQGEDSGLIVCQAKFNCSVRAKYFNPKTTKVKYTAESGLPDWEGDIVGTLTSSSIPNKSNIAEVEIGSHVTSIWQSAFRECRGLTSVTIPDSVTSIGNWAFQNCRGLTSITIGNGVTNIGTYTFGGCSALTSMTIPDSVTSIGSSAFRECSGLTSVTIGNSVTSIGSSAFEFCDGLTSVTFSGKIKSTVKGMSNYSWGLPSGCVIHCTDGDITVGSETVVYYTDGRVVELDIQGELGSNSIPDKASISELVIGNTVTSIGDFAFSQCSSLTSVIIPNSVTSIKSAAFERCINLTSIEIPNSVTEIGNEAFWNCTGLESVTIPDGVTSIGRATFFGCSGLTSVSIPDSVTDIGDGAFSQCSGITSVSFGSNVTSIGSSAFEGCSQLTGVSIPNSVTYIGSSAFKDCHYLTGISFDGKDKATVQGMENYSWELDSGCAIYCTDGYIII